ncbi:MAG TPA: YCF48-related protein, partial [Ignavibacteria bacterium]
MGTYLYKNKKSSRILYAIILTFALFFFSSAGFRDTLVSGWYQQWITGLNGSTIKDMTFLDSLTGFAVTNVNSSYLGFILKTTNGGDNWTINYTYNPPYTNVSFIKIKFINDNTGYAITDYIHLIKTTNSGDNWFSINSNIYPEDVSIINSDTIMAVKSNGLNGGVYRTTNGGYNWQLIWTNGSAG